ncbi:hypothetical protein O181_037685 [Austropuccinia psidii MF-1]|uniref:Uncharacterized protein n=1 Tax=Austropuccinia psidii MF-1 TaxID=1389203 RepID=A0A9Q3D8M1_9BASI|nr:hypothetical protein [Austropuccinia psidii MF-1]
MNDEAWGHFDQLVQILSNESSQEISNQKELSMNLLQQIEFNLLSSNPQGHAPDKLDSSQLDCFSDDEISTWLIAEEENLRSNFSTIDRKYSKSVTELRRLISLGQDDLKAQKAKTMMLHDDFLKLEDDFIDYIESDKTSIDRQDVDSSPNWKKSFAVQIAWLKQLDQLKLWFTVLLGFRDRTFLLVQQAHQPDFLLQQPSPFEPLADELCNLIESYQHFIQLTQIHNLSDFHLFQVVQQVISHSLHSIMESISIHVAKIVEDEIQWPLPQDIALEFDSPSTGRILNGFKTAAAFQKKLEARPDLIYLSEGKNKELDEKHIIWYPLVEGSIVMKALIRPIKLRFRFHFDSQRTTNRLDKPEWYFNHVLDRLIEHEYFIKTDLQKLFELSNQRSIDVFCDFAAQLIRLVENKLRHSIPQILALKPILAHTIEKAIEFDRFIKEGSYLIQTLPSRKFQKIPWMGTADVILGEDTWFATWFEAERQFADDTCLEIISSKDTWELNDDDQRPISMHMHATNSSLKIQDLCEQIKLKYEALPRVHHQAQFLLKVQFTVLEAYLQRISGVLDGFERGGFIQVVGVDSGRSKMIVGLNGLDRLVKIHISCLWMLNALKVWNDDLFYVELHEKLKADKSHKMVEVDELLRSIESGKEADGTLFNPMVKRFEGLLARTESFIIRQVVQEVLSELKPYFSKRWDTQPENPRGENKFDQQFDLSNELLSPLTLWKQSVALIRRTIQPPIRLSKILKMIGKEIEAQFIAKIVDGPSLRSITEYGGQQLKFDISMGWIDGIPKPEQMFGRLLDCCRLLGLPCTTGKFNTHGLTQNDHHEQIGISKVVRICFDEEISEKDALKMLKDQVGVSKLNRGECQKVLKRRPECWKNCPTLRIDPWPNSWDVSSWAIVSSDSQSYWNPFDDCL